LLVVTYPTTMLVGCLNSAEQTGSLVVSCSTPSKAVKYSVPSTIYLNMVLYLL
jgi:hypothetical protein